MINLLIQAVHWWGPQGRWDPVGEPVIPILSRRRKSSRRSPGEIAASPRPVPSVPCPCPVRAGLALSEIRIRWVTAWQRNLPNVRLSGGCQVDFRWMSGGCQWSHRLFCSWPRDMLGCRSVDSTDWNELWILKYAIHIIYIYCYIYI